MRSLRILEFIIVIAIVLIGIIFYHINTAKQSRKVEQTEISLYAIKPGSYNWSKQQAIQMTFTYELIARMWNKYPEHRFWLKKYIEALAADSTFTIDEKQKIEIRLE